MKEKLTIQDLKDRGLLLYEYVRGSHAYGLQKPDGTSDIDLGGVYLEPVEDLLGLQIDVQDQVADERNDEVYWSLGKFMRLILSSNPTVLESLFIPDKCVKFEHPIMKWIKQNRDHFITKDCFNPFIGYAVNQIKKARSLKKKIVQPMDGPRKSILEFATTFKDQGTISVKEHLANCGLMNKYCGLVHQPKMDNMYGVYYDFMSHVWYEFKIQTAQDFMNDCIDQVVHSKKRQKFYTTLLKHYGIEKVNTHFDQDLLSWFNEHKDKKDFGYKGIVNIDESSNELRICSSIPMGEKPVFQINYTLDGYQQYCKAWREWQDFKINRNEERFNLAKEKQFDRKNVAHAVRLMHMGLEIARGEGVKIDRTDIDRDEIMKIRLGDADYDEIINKLESQKDEMKEAMINAKLPEHIDVDFVNDMLLKIRTWQLYGQNEIDKMMWKDFEEILEANKDVLIRLKNA